MFLGAPPPPELHTHYAADGETVTGYTVVERDSPWDDRQRARMFALVEYETGIHRCGIHSSVLADPEHNVLVPDEGHCAGCAAFDVWSRMKAAEDEAFEKKLGEKPDPKTPRPGDGRSLFLRPATPKELAERAEKRRPGRG